MATMPAQHMLQQQVLVMSCVAMFVISPSIIMKAAFGRLQWRHPLWRRLHCCGFHNRGWEGGKYSHTTHPQHQLIQQVLCKYGCCTPADSASVVKVSAAQYWRGTGNRLITINWEISENPKILERTDKYKTLYVKKHANMWKGCGKYTNIHGNIRKYMEINNLHEFAFIAYVLTCIWNV